MIPRTFEEWKQCIVHDCKIKLTKEFAVSRLRVYEDAAHTETKKFVALYGLSHLQRVIYWYEKIAHEQ